MVGGEPGAEGGEQGLGVDAEADTGVMPTAVRVDQGGEFLVQPGGVGAQCMYGPPGLGQAILGHPMGLVQQAQRPAGIALLGQQGTGGLELDAQRAEGVGENVVDLAGDARLLVQHCGPALLGAQLLHLRHQRPHGVP